MTVEGLPKEEQEEGMHHWKGNKGREAVCYIMIIKDVEVQKYGGTAYGYVQKWWMVAK